MCFLKVQHVVLAKDQLSANNYDADAECLQNFFADD
jgi:hypothetical protein